MLSTNQKGAIAEAKIAARATELGIEVYRPTFDGARADLILAIGDDLVRTQCKYASLGEGAIVIRAYTSRRSRTGMVMTTYRASEIDALAAYCAANDSCYLLPVALVEGRRVVHLRTTPTRNNQAIGINWASQYEFGAIAQLGERLAGSQKVVGSSPTSSTP